ncbi:helix-turn-helix domain-containing protein [Streptomyces sp. NPDC054904]|uniref:helix-turn-helix domain-containing protein n=1 Tax=unclassified Streptomyces TaxID=2593676 RepID=UPI002481D2E4|nr:MULTISPECIES: helix-turn-helix transcriptional regulator [unclassified Streptomyces]MDA5280471.1 helix-turn-helix transcriptional regulator [Streptomyces sp. Isolate_45]MDX2389744.1 helix-turn-helix transcriptional regulator [Streptomyces sp. DK15]
MPPRTAPTERQKRLGAELRRMRLAADVTAESAAGLLGVDRSKVSAIEQGIRAISEERLRTLACHCDCVDEEYLDALAAMTQPRKRGWWERYRGSLSAPVLDIAELEAHATRMRCAHSVHVPGLLQTSDHALALFRLVLPALPDHEIALRLAHRLERQQVLEGEAAPQYVTVIHEAALRMQFGGRKVARAQLEHLNTAAERDNVVLRVLTFEAGGFPGAGQTVNYLEGAVPRLDTVQVDSTHGPDFLHTEAQLAKYRAQLDWMEKLSLSPEASRDFIHTVARQL